MALALIKQLQLCFGYKKQPNLAFSTMAAGDMWSLQSTNAEVPFPEFVNETNRDDIGTGLYATQIFPSHINLNFQRQARLTSEWFAVCVAFGCGAITKTAVGTGGFKYVGVAPSLTSLVADDLEMPSTTWVAKLSSVSDKKLIGCCLEEWRLSLKSGPGRDNAQISTTWTGTGQFVSPSSITIPAPYAEHSLNAGNITALTIMGVDYIAAKRFVSAEFGWKNNIDENAGHHPGSGTQSGYQIRGKMRRGTPTFTFTAVVEAVTGSAEEANLLSQADGTAVITIEGAAIGAAKHTAKITCHRVSIVAAPIGNNNGVSTYQLTFEMKEHTANGVVTLEAICEQDNILATAA